MEDERPIKTQGECAYCGKVSTRTGMARHLRTCAKRKEVLRAADLEPGKSRPFIHLQVQDSWSGEYWLHLEMDGSATLDDLDAYLRTIWLECCDHLSQFAVGKRFGQEVDFEVRAKDVLRPGVELTHMYDFGTTSYTLVRAVDVRSGKPTTSNPIVLMARNAPPPLPCMQCGKPSTQLCMECAEEYGEWTPLCDAHVAVHEHEADDMMPPVNSPRLGMCGYDGPAEPPY
ncbi:MAG: hypothetical protein ABW277_00720 [Longimicrobiaceae bacterium]